MAPQDKTAQQIQTGRNMNNAILRFSAIKCSNTGLKSFEQHRTHLLQEEEFRWHQMPYGK